MAYKSMAIALIATSAQAWNDCAFPDVDYFVVDEGIGISFGYGATGMNGKLYNGGYMKGHLGYVGVTDSGVVEPNPAATMWGDAESDIQHLYVAEIDSTGKMEQSWFFKSSNIQVGSPGHGASGDRVQVNGVQAMLDKAHLTVKGDFRYTLTMPDGTTQLLGPQRADGSTRANTVDPVQFIMKLDVSKANGVGAGTTGWVMVLDEFEDGAGNLLHPGGVDVNYAVNLHGDANGDVILTYTGCDAWDPTADGVDGYGRPTPGSGAQTGCKHYLVKHAAADASEVWRFETPVLLTSAVRSTPAPTISSASTRCQRVTHSWTLATASPSPPTPITWRHLQVAACSMGPPPLITRCSSSSTRVASRSGRR
jgi:hypothetical protein